MSRSSYSQWMAWVWTHYHEAGKSSVRIDGEVQIDGRTEPASATIVVDWYEDNITGQVVYNISDAEEEWHLLPSGIDKSDALEQLVEGHDWGTKRQVFTHANAVGRTREAFQRETVDGYLEGVLDLVRAKLAQDIPDVAGAIAEIDGTKAVVA